MVLAAHSGGSNDCCSMLLSVLMLLGSGASSKSGESERAVSFSTKLICFLVEEVEEDVPFSRSRSLDVACDLIDGQKLKIPITAKFVLP